MFPARILLHSYSTKSTLQIVLNRTILTFDLYNTRQFYKVLTYILIWVSCQFTNRSSAGPTIPVLQIRTLKSWVKWLAQGYPAGKRQSYDKNSGPLTSEFFTTDGAKDGHHGGGWYLSKRPWKAAVGFNVQERSWRVRYRWRQQSWVIHRTESRHM